MASNNTNVGSSLTGPSLRSSIKNTLNSTYGYTDAEVKKLMKVYNSGLDANANLDKMRETKVWKDRFKGNAILEATGQGSISEDEYLARERAYTDLMDNYSALLTRDLNKRTESGRLIPNRDVMAKWIGGDASVQEVADRFESAIKYVDGINPELRQQLAEYYGIDDANLKKYILNFRRSDIDWNKEFATVTAGAAAQKAGIDINKEFATTLGNSGLNEQQLQYGMNEVGKTADTAALLSSISGENLTTEELAGAEFGINVEAEKKVKKIIGTEEAAFGGSGAGTNILGSATSGQI